MAHDVFISYSSRDKPTADAVCYELEAAGIRCWIAPRDILPGQHWGAAIVEAIHSSRLMVLILSANANASDQVLREVERSVHRSIPIIPFRIEEFELASAFEYYLSVPHWLDAMTGPMEDHIQRLVHTAKVLLDQERPPQAVPAAPPQSPGPAPDDDAQLEAVVRPQPGDFAPPPPREPPAAAAMPTVAVASMASILPPSGSAPMRRPRAMTKRTAPSRSSTPAIVAATISPTLWPIT